MTPLTLRVFGAFLCALCLSACAANRRSVSRDEILKALASEDEGVVLRSAVVSPAELRVMLPKAKTPGNKRTLLGRVRISARDGSVAELIDFEPTTPAGFFHRCSALVLLEQEGPALSSCAALLESGTSLQKLAAIELLRRAMSERQGAEEILIAFRLKSGRACDDKPEFERCEEFSRASAALSLSAPVRSNTQRVTKPGTVLFHVRARGPVSLWRGKREIKRFDADVDSVQNIEVKLTALEAPLDFEWRAISGIVEVESFGGSTVDAPLTPEIAQEEPLTKIVLSRRQARAPRRQGRRSLAELDALLTDALSSRGPASVLVRDALMLRFGDAPQILSYLGQSADPRLERVYWQQDREKFAKASMTKMPSLAWPRATLDAPQNTVDRLAFFGATPSPRRSWSREALEAALTLERSDQIRRLYQELQRDTVPDDLPSLQRSEELLFLREVITEDAAPPSLPASLERMSESDAETLFLREPERFAKMLEDSAATSLSLHQWHVRSAAEKSPALLSALADFPLNTTFLEISKQEGLRLTAFPGEDELFACQSAAAPVGVSEGETRLLLDDQRVFITAQQRVEYRHRQIYIGDRQAAEDYGELATDLDTWRLRFRKYRAGNMERGQALTQESLALSQLDIGDIVEVCTLSFESANADAREVLAFSELASADARRTLAVHRDVFPSVKLLPMAEGVERTQDGDFEVWRLQRQLPARPPEYFTASAGKEEGVPALLQRSTLARSDEGADPWLKRVSAAAIGKAGGKAAAGALARMVLQTIEHDPAQMDVMLTLSSGKGHRGLLLFALAQAAGLSVELFGLWHGERFYSPTLYEDEWALRFAFFLDELWVLPGTTPSLGEIPRRFQGSLRYRNEKSVFSTTSIDKPNAEVLDEDDVESTPVEVELALAWVNASHSSTRGHWEGTLTWSLPAGHAAVLRRGLRASNPAQRNTALVGAVKSLLPEAEVRDVAFTGLESVGDPLGVGVRLHVPAEAGFDDVNFDGSELGAFVDPTLFVAQSSREHTLWLPSFKSVFTLRIERPPEGSFISLPSSASLKAPGVQVSLRSSASDEGLSIRREFTSSARPIKVEDYPSWRRRMLQLFDDSAIRFEVLLPLTSAGLPMGKADAGRSR